jgi:hypothetical protein
MKGICGIVEKKFFVWWLSVRENQGLLQSVAALE